MTSTPPARLVMAEDLLAPGSPYRDCELWDGIPMVREPQNPWPSQVAVQILYRLSRHLEGEPLGLAFDADGGFLLARRPDRMLAADVTFVSNEKLASIPQTGFAPFAPDFVVEVKSPSDDWGDVLIKCGVWLAHGVSLVWAVDPESRLVVVKRPGAPVEDVRPGGTLSGEPVLPNFRMAVEEAFAGLPPARPPA